MKEPSANNYKQIEKAIAYIKTHFENQINVEEVARHLQLSAMDFQQLFSDWAGSSASDFLQYTHIHYFKKQLGNQQATLFDNLASSNFSNKKFQYDSFITIEEMTSEQYQDNEKNQLIHFDFSTSPFGNLIIASTSKGVCYLAFEDDDKKALSDLKQYFPNALFLQKRDLLQQNALLLFQNNDNKPTQIKLHLKGTPFQLSVWKALLKIPMGKLSTYKDIATEIGNIKAARAVGTAIGNNPIGFLIPCHRIIQSSGNIGGYMWGPLRKMAMIAWEGVNVNAIH